MISRGQSISKSDLDALATLANAKLLPLINAAIAAKSYDLPFNLYDIAGTFISDSDPYILNPQPDYAFNDFPTEKPVNLIPSNAAYDADGNYSVSVSTNSWYKIIFGANEATEFQSGLVSFNGSISLFPGVSFSQSDVPDFPSYDSTLATFSGTANAPVTAQMFLNPQNWFRELNRIRGDLMYCILNDISGAEELYQNLDMVMSGPWVVAVNDPDTFAMDNDPSSYIPNSIGPFFSAGEIYGNYSTTDLVLFKNVQFCYAESDSFDCSVRTGRKIGSSDSNVDAHFLFSYTGDGQLESTLVCMFSGAVGSPPAASSFTIVDASTVSITWSTVAGISDGEFVLVGKIGEPISGTGKIEVTITAPSGYTLNDDGFDGSNSACLMDMVAELFFATNAAKNSISGLHPSSAIKSISCDDIPADSDFVINDVNGFGIWKLSDPKIKGIWIANTLPTPGMNVFLDSDIPPYIGTMDGGFGGGIPIAISNALAVDAFGGIEIDLGNGEETILWADNPPTNQADNSQPFYASSMRQQAGIYRGEMTRIIDGISIDLGPEYNLVSQSLQCQPSQWPVKRDTDDEPFDYGFNTDSFLEYTTGQVLLSGNHANYNLSLNFDPPSTVIDPSDLRWIKIRVVESGSATKVWHAGSIFYGSAASDKLKIFVSTFNYPSPDDPDSYEFVSINNEVNVPGDISLAAAKSAQNLFFTVLNTDTGNEISYDIVTDISLSLLPERRFFPPPGTSECFSIQTDGNYYFSRVLTDDSNADNDYANKPIPQNGYCIFKLRARRLPLANAAGINVTPTSGDEIKIVIGQNRLQFDGTLSFAPFLTRQTQFGSGDAGIGAGDGGGAGGSGELFTITIPADARDSGDVDVFFPVLGGNELVYQCSEQIILEAWANWQPMFHFGYYGLKLNQFTYGEVLQNPTAFQPCLRLTNFFLGDESNLPYDLPQQSAYYVTQTRFPASADIYNDLTAALNLI